MFGQHNDKILFGLVAATMLYTAYLNAKIDLKSEQNEIKQVVNQSKNSDQIIEKFIMNNPEVILKSLEQMQKRRAMEEQERVKHLLEGKKSEIESSKFAPFSGNETGKITIVKLYDYGCGYCKKIDAVLEELIKKNKDVKIIYKQLPVLGDSSIYLARMALAVYYTAPEKFPDFHRKALALGGAVTKEKMRSLIKQISLDYNALEEASDTRKVRDELKRSRELATKIRIHGVPALIINGEVFPGMINLDKLEQIIDNVGKDPADKPSEEKKEKTAQ